MKTTKIEAEVRALCDILSIETYACPHGEYVAVKFDDHHHHTIWYRDPDEGKRLPQSSITDGWREARQYITEYHNL